MKKILLGGASALAVAVIAFRVPPTRLVPGTATAGIAHRHKPTISPTPISTVTSPITDTPSPSPTITGNIRNGIPCVIRIRRPVRPRVLNQDFDRVASPLRALDDGPGAGAPSIAAQIR